MYWHMEDDERLLAATACGDAEAFAVFSMTRTSPGSRNWPPPGRGG
jgi:hypothetical protein